jgi:hypothetical protein
MFGVIAGKIDSDQSWNCKYSDEFETLGEAIKAYDEVSSYTWAYITYEGRYLDLCYKEFNPFN